MTILFSLPSSWVDISPFSALWGRYELFICNVASPLSINYLDIINLKKVKMSNIITTLMCNITFDCFGEYFPFFRWYDSRRLLFLSFLCSSDIAAHRALSFSLLHSLASVIDSDELDEAWPSTVYKLYNKIYVVWIMYLLKDIFTVTSVGGVWRIFKWCPTTVIFHHIHLK